MYAGTVGGGVLASVCAEHFGWRSSFLGFGGFGLCLLFVLLLFLKEPGQARMTQPAAAKEREPVGASLRGIVDEILLTPLVLRLIVVFVGANFVAMVFMVWLPSFLFNRFHLSLAMAGVNATVYLQAASVGGVLSGGMLADTLARNDRGGRMRTQALGLIAGAAFLFLTGWTLSLRILIAGMIGFGFCKGIYESNLWASLHDVVRPERRAVAVGMMNSLGWIGGGLAPLAIAAGSRRFGMGACISATSVIYLLIAAILLWNARKAAAQKAQPQLVCD